MTCVVCDLILANSDPSVPPFLPHLDIFLWNWQLFSDRNVSVVGDLVFWAGGGTRIAFECSRKQIRGRKYDM